MATFKITRQVGNPDFLCTVRTKFATTGFVSYNIAICAIEKVLSEQGHITGKSNKIILPEQEICKSTDA
ncbi:UNVERIFIED_CONTAM: hypothetical protein NCL1_23914 [Trichonephila clavipes]